MATPALVAAVILIWRAGDRTSCRGQVSWYLATPLETTRRTALFRVVRMATLGEMRRSRGLSGLAS